MVKRVRHLPGFGSNWVIGANKLIQGEKLCLLGRRSGVAGLTVTRLWVLPDKSFLATRPQARLCFCNQPRPLRTIHFSPNQDVSSLFSMSQ